MGNNKIEEIDINKIFSNSENPRNIKNEKFDKLCESINNFPEMLNIRPIVINSKNEIIGGNMRYKACKVIGLKKVPIIRANNLTLEQEKEFIIKDNVSSGQWDWDILGNEWDSQNLDTWGLDTWLNMDDLETKDDFMLESGEKQPYQQMSFKLADNQALIIKEAINKVKKLDDYKNVENYGNNNANGNALFYIINKWVERKK